MKISRAFAVLLIFLSVGIIGLAMSAFTVDQRERAILLQLGQPVGDVVQPGLHFKLPVIQSVRYFDARILSVDPPAAQMVISSGRDNPVAPDKAEESGDVNACDTLNAKSL